MTALGYGVLFIVLAAVSAVLVRVMIRVGRLDHPVERSSHAVPTPKGGGVGIVAAMLLGGFWLARGGDDGAAASAAAMVLGAAFLGGVSYLDDLYDWPFLAKLAAQAAAACGFMLAGGALRQVMVPGFGMLALGAAGPLLSLVWLLFVTNAVNFMDGLNGLASGSVAVAAIAGMIAAPWPFAALALPLVAGIAGFLPFNYPWARIFMGDVGSQPLGFAVAALAILGAQQTRCSLAICVVVTLALLPMLADVAFTLVRRARNGARLTQAHRSHVYQVANRAGMPAWQVTLVYWGMAACGGALGLWASKAGGLWAIKAGSPWASRAGGRYAAGYVTAAPDIGPLAQIAGVGAVALAMFGLWSVYVVRRAARAGLTRW